MGTKVAGTTLQGPTPCRWASRFATSPPRSAPRPYALNQGTGQGGPPGTAGRHRHDSVRAPRRPRRQRLRRTPSNCPAPDSQPRMLQGHLHDDTRGGSDHPGRLAKVAGAGGICNHPHQVRWSASCPEIAPHRIPAPVDEASEISWSRALL